MPFCKQARVSGRTKRLDKMGVDWPRDRSRKRGGMESNNIIKEGDNTAGGMDGSLIRIILK
jgi:hypothetical protein